jgi:hypothetical protein
MEPTQFIFWGCLLAAFVLLAVGLPENRRSSWGVAVVFGLVDIAILGFKLFPK